MTYDLLQGELAANFEPRSLPVAVVDISELKVEPSGDSYATPRGELMEVMKAIAMQNPRAIGVDIDFSAENNKMLADDPVFFRFCELLRIPVYLGVGRTQLKNPDVDWLPGAPKESPVSILIPADASQMIRWIEKGTDAGMRRPGLAAALAKHGDPRPEPDGPAARLGGGILAALERMGIIESDFEIPLKNDAGETRFTLDEFLVDYGPLDLLSANTLKLTPRSLRDTNFLEGLAEYWKDRISGKLVLIGDSTKGAFVDPVNVPDRLLPAPGVLVHACAVYTLLNRPVNRLTEIGRVVVDVMLSLAAFGAILLVRLHYKTTQSEVQTHRLYNLLVLAIIVGVIVFAVGLIKSTRVIWDDYLLVIAGLIAHGPLERFSEGAREWAKHRGPGVMRRFLFGGNEGGEP
jgi:hypothetical protein